ncbi:MAG TPA: hypothetical protein VF150_04535 [Thermoanaerobaculia bacterium]
MQIQLRAIRGFLAAAALLALAAPASAQYYGGDNTLRFRGGLFEPEGDSEYWDDAAALFTSDAQELEDVVLGFDYQRGLAGDGRLSLLLSASAFEGEEEREDRFFVEEPGGFPIEHTATLTVASFTAGLNLNFAPRAPVQPYVGVGGGYYVWELEEHGDFVFEGPQFDEVFRERFVDDGATLGYYWLAGLAVPIGRDFAVFAEGRWHRAEDELGGDFDGFGDLDLSGREISGGFSWTF